MPFIRHKGDSECELCRYGCNIGTPQHYLSLVVSFMALANRIMAGSDVSTTWVQFLYLAAGCAIGFMFILRLQSPSKTRPATVSGSNR